MNLSFTISRFFKVQKLNSLAVTSATCFTISRFFKVQKQKSALTSTCRSFTISRFFKVQKPQIQNLNSSINLPKIWFLHPLVIEILDHTTSHILKYRSLPLIIPNLY